MGKEWNPKERKRERNYENRDVLINKFFFYIIFDSEIKAYILQNTDSEIMMFLFPTKK